jgi:hypothetical protein
MKTLKAKRVVYRYIFGGPFDGCTLSLGQGGGWRMFIKSPGGDTKFSDTSEGPWTEILYPDRCAAFDAIVRCYPHDTRHKGLAREWKRVRPLIDLAASQPKTLDELQGY